VPKISICLPNLNNRAFLDERLASIFAQTFTDWELIVSDNFSDDGAWELLQRAAQAEPRIQLAQAPRHGMYDNWNNCIRRATGDYVYIATSDDTMMPTCLAELAAALDRHADCELAFCPAVAIDASSREIPAWWPSREAPRFFGEWMNRPHIRRAPHDGILHAALGMLYESITQLLIRRSLFDRVGLFRTDFGSKADFEWEMRASLVASTVYVPTALATWRIHPQQATKDAEFATAEHWDQITEMVELAVAAAEKIAPRQAASFSRERLCAYFAGVAYQLCLARSNSAAEKLGCLWRRGFRHPSVWQRALACRFRGQPFNLPERAVHARELLHELQAPALVPL
jgi:glycosyltransferase involved in cell wall biosynthesis